MERVYCLPLLFLIISTAFIQIPLCVPSVLVGRDTVVPPHPPTPPTPLTPLTPLSCQNRKQSITFPVFPHFSCANSKYHVPVWSRLAVVFALDKRWVRARCTPDQLGQGPCSRVPRKCSERSVESILHTLKILSTKKRLFSVFPGFNV